MARREHDTQEGLLPSQYGQRLPQHRNGGKRPQAGEPLLPEPEAEATIKCPAFVNKAEAGLWVSLKELPAVR